MITSTQPRHSRLVLLLFTIALLGPGCRETSEDVTPDLAAGDMTRSDLAEQPDEQDMSSDQDMSTTEEPDLSLPEEDLGPIPDTPLTYEAANGCFRIRAVAPPGKDEDTSTAPSRYLTATTEPDGFLFSDTEASAARVLFRASDLGTYLLYDQDAHYLTLEEVDTPPQAPSAFERKDQILSDILTIDDTYLPGAQWELIGSPRDPEAVHLRHLKSGRYMSIEGVEAGLHRAALLYLEPAEQCATFPELTLDASGQIEARTFEDGSLYGIVDTHSHILSNFGFGGGGLFHGSAFHPFGVEHALPSCEPFHGEEGRKDLFGYGFDERANTDSGTLLQTLVSGMTPEFNHFTDGYPNFTTWPSAPFSSTHQTQYYRWIERAYLGGLRLVVQHATSNKIICDLIAGEGTQPTRYSCNDMVAVDRILEETYRMERYIDAQHGGPGKGWFRIVTSPDQARKVIGEGKLAVILGIEVSHLFECRITPEEGEERCTEQDVTQRLDQYWNKGVRVLFPVHKYDNGFSAGDGSKDLIEVGNFAQSGHWSNFTQDCPQIPSAFDNGPVGVGGLNQPRDDYFATPPNDMSKFPQRPIPTLFKYLSELTEGPLEGDYCQNAGLTPLGEFLITEMMHRGMIVEIDHLPRRSYQRAFEILKDHDYPAAGTHGNTNNGKLYELGGVSRTHFGRCSDPQNPGGRLAEFNNRLTQIRAAGSYEAEGLGFDLNGFAGAIKPRFGAKSTCATPQENPIVYPFTSYDGAVTFSTPFVGNREIDYNTEGFVHIGMLPELLEDLRHDGATDEDLEPLFRSAEGYLRMWEKSERRAKEMNP